MAEQTFVSSFDFPGPPVRAAAVYCSDGRFASHCGQFLREGLGLERCDRIVFPGGPACLAGRFFFPNEEAGLRDQLRWIAEAHKLERIVLIAHSQCAFYARHMVEDQDAIFRAQLDDLAAAADRITGLAPRVIAETYFARVDEGRVIFEPVPVH